MEQSDIIQISKKYAQVFKSKDLSLMDRFFTKNVTKTGLLFDYESNNWVEAITVGM